MNNAIQHILFDQSDIDALASEVGRDSLMGRTIQAHKEEVEKL